MHEYGVEKSRIVSPDGILSWEALKESHIIMCLLTPHKEDVQSYQTFLPEQSQW